MNFLKRRQTAILFLLGFCFSPQSMASEAKAIFAGGCFWCLEADFDKLKGVKKTISGYDGGSRKKVTYGLVSSGTTDYVEALSVYYDPKVINYEELLNYFWRHIDPLDSGGQFCDRGPQYVSVIFYLNEEQKRLAIASKKALTKRFGPIATKLLPSTHFVVAESYHQNYYKKNPLSYRYYRYRCGRDKRVKDVWREAP